MAINSCWHNDSFVALTINKLYRWFWRQLGWYAEEFWVIYQNHGNDSYSIYTECLRSYEETLQEAKKSTGLGDYKIAYQVRWIP